MDDKYEEIVKQYDLQKYARKRTRGGILITTEKGHRLLTNYRGTLSRLQFAEEVKKQLSKKGSFFVDKVVPDKEGMLIVTDVMGENWCLKEWYLGEECNLRDGRQARRAAAHLAKMHKQLRVSEGLEKYYYSNVELPELLEKHTREMKHVRSYIRGKKRKNEMEINLLNSFPMFYEQACRVLKNSSADAWGKLWLETKQERRVRHGSYTYHNILFGGNQVITINFEKAEIGVQIRDLYDFLRKVMEKNNWSKEMGIKLLESYQKIRPLEQEEKEILYLLLSYPEKYWKIVNCYFNNKKSWMSCKNLEKLQKVIGQETMRTLFLKEMREYLELK